ncbi:PREDICTED: uncharacterized protein LOC109234791 [Nicotiana attenuata]|uniref:uncharacterized protein LOC109234791 n=1 Tax=Nicotiana attenuata TaxID=49451 RepID=UPI00090597C3|nr:PREDICTED: uncharacterized protein LOC109234791 [Nicotiana attenuata]
MDNILVGDQGGSSMLRDYRKGNWTVQETMVLIEAKKMDDERRNRRQGDISERGKPTELRWKWVEDYCWRNGCLRSQNQCNDKWDNLMRDFKKVREYERREAEKAAEGGEEIMRSYWKIEKNERKEKSLPTNMLPQIYEALVEVVDRKGQRFLPASNSLPPTLQQQSTQPQITPLPLPPLPLPPPPTVVAQTAAHQLSDVAYTGQYPFPTIHQPRKERMSGEGTSSGTAKGNINNSSQEVGSAISKSAAIIAEAIQSCEEREERRHRELRIQPCYCDISFIQYLLHYIILMEFHLLYVYVLEMCDSSDPDTSDHRSDSPAKKRRMSGEGTSSGTAKGNINNSSQEVGSAISKSAAIIAEAIQSCEEREERRHRELLTLHERRLQIEESNAEINREGINGLVDSINKLANSILALAGNKNQSAP